MFSFTQGFQQAVAFLSPAKNNPDNILFFQETAQQHIRAVAEAEARAQKDRCFQARSGQDGQEGWDGIDQLRMTGAL